jgi:hypothetical protein
MTKNPATPRTLLIALFSLFHLLSLGQSGGLNVDSTYNFSPHKLSKSGKEARMKDLDSFWNKVKADTVMYLPKLRTELASNNHAPFFYFDGATLLLWLSNSKSDEKLAAESIAKTDLEDVDWKIYVQLLNSLAFDSINVLQAALKILKYPNFNFYLEEHVMYFHQENSLAYCLLPLKNEWYVDTLIARFESADTAARFSILYTLWMGYSCKGDSMIKAVAKSTHLPKDIRGFADTLSTYVFEIDQAKTSLPLEELKEKRLNSLKRFSDEGLGDLFTYSVALRKKTSCEQVSEMIKPAKSGNPHSENSRFVQQIIGSDEFKAEQKKVDSLNKVSGTQVKVSFSIIENSNLPGDDPNLISVGFIEEETSFAKTQVYTLKFDKKAQKIISVTKN